MLGQVPSTQSPMDSLRELHEIHTRLICHFTDGDSENRAQGDRTIMKGQDLDPASVRTTDSPLPYVHFQLFTDRSPLSPNCQTGTVTKKINLKFLKYQNLKTYN